MHKNVQFRIIYNSKKTGNNLNTSNRWMVESATWYVAEQFGMKVVKMV